MYANAFTHMHTWFIVNHSIWFTQFIRLKGLFLRSSLDLKKTNHTQAKSPQNVEHFLVWYTTKYVWFYWGGGRCVVCINVWHNTLLIMLYVVVWSPVRVYVDNAQKDVSQDFWVRSVPCEDQGWAKVTRQTLLSLYILESRQSNYFHQTNNQHAKHRTNYV